MNNLTRQTVIPPGTINRIISSQVLKITLTPSLRFAEQGRSEHKETLKMKLKAIFATLVTYLAVESGKYYMISYVAALALCPLELGGDFAGLCTRPVNCIPLLLLDFSLWIYFSIGKVRLNCSVVSSKVFW